MLSVRVSAPDMMRLERLAFAGDLDAARELARVCDRYGLGDGLKRRLARVLLDGGERFSARSYSGDGTGDVQTILWWGDQEQGGRPRLTSPVEVALCWGEREARGYLCDLGIRAIERVVDPPIGNMRRYRDEIEAIRRGERDTGSPYLYVARESPQSVLAIISAVLWGWIPGPPAWERSLWRRAYRVNEAAREAMSLDGPWRRSRLLEYLLGEVT